MTGSAIASIPFQPPNLGVRALPNPTRKYVCDYQTDNDDPSIYMPIVAKLYPFKNWTLQTAETNPLVPLGRACVVMTDVDADLHDEIMQIPGVEQLDD